MCGVEGGERREFVGTDPAIGGFPFRNFGAGHVHQLGDLTLREAGSLARGTKARRKCRSLVRGCVGHPATASSASLASCASRILRTSATVWLIASGTFVSSSTQMFASHGMDLPIGRAHV